MRTMVRETHPCMIKILLNLLGNSIRVISSLGSRRTLKTDTKVSDLVCSLAPALFVHAEEYLRLRALYDQNSSEFTWQ